MGTRRTIQCPVHITLPEMITVRDFDDNEQPILRKADVCLRFDNAWELAVFYYAAMHREATVLARNPYVIDGKQFVVKPTRARMLAATMTNRGEDADAVVNASWESTYRQDDLVACLQALQPCSVNDWTLMLWAVADLTHDRKRAARRPACAGPGFHVNINMH